MTDLNTRSMAAVAYSQVTPVVRAARRLLRAAERATPITVMSVAPTYTQGAANANSTINTSALAIGQSDSRYATQGPTYKGNDARLEYVSANVVLDSYNAYGWIPNHITRAASGNYALRGTDGWGVRFCTDAQAFDFLANLGTTQSGSGANGVARVCVTDLSTKVRQWTQTADYVGDGNWRYYKIDFGSRAPRGRVIEIYFSNNAWFNGINVGAQDMVWKTSFPDEPKICYFGDSYGEGAGSTYIRKSLPYLFGELMGVPNVISSAVSGTGYVNPGSGVAWPSRMSRDLASSLIGDVDLVEILGSINDGGYSDSAVSAAIIGAIPEAMAAQPNAIFHITGPQYVNLGRTTTARWTAVKTAVQSLSEYGTRLFYTDNGSDGENWQTGLGYQGAPTGVGNGDFYVHTDKTHPSDIAVGAGHAYLAGRLRATVTNILVALDR